VECTRRASQACEACWAGSAGVGGAASAPESRLREQERSSSTFKSARQACVCGLPEWSCGHGSCEQLPNNHIRRQVNVCCLKMHHPPRSAGSQDLHSLHTGAAAVKSVLKIKVCTHYMMEAVSGMTWHPAPVGTCCCNSPIAQTQSPSDFAFVAEFLLAPHDTIGASAPPGQ
jgi:hypothetical protein